VALVALALTVFLPVRARAALATPTVSAVALFERNHLTTAILGAILLVETALVAGLVGVGRKRRAVERALVQSDRLKSGILSSVPAHIAVLDSYGVITAVNERWTDFGRANGSVSDAAVGVGANYLRVCERAARFGDPVAAEALVWIQAVCRGDTCDRQIEYRCDSPDQQRWFLMTITPLRPSDGGAVLTHWDITDRKRNELAIRETESLLRRISDRRSAEAGRHELSRRLIVAQEEERSRIARELHDHLNQQLALLAIDLQQLSMSAPSNGLSVRLDELWRRTNEISSDVHGLSHRLHPSKLEALGLVATIRGHCRDISRQGVVVHFAERNTPNGIPADVSLCLFRVVEEALSNVVRHSQATEAYVTLEEIDREIVLHVVDGGRGFAHAVKADQAGLGLVSMHERLGSVGGTLKVDSAPGHGSVVEARVPRDATVPSPFDVDAESAIPARTLSVVH
jgi:signal transduction histidine kinase